MKIAVLVSGGVDSSVALKLLKDQGHDVTAFYLKIWLEDELAYLGNCPWQEDLSFVQQVCDQLQVPLQVIPLQKEYWSRVVAYVIDQVKSGNTPNPDMLCNQQVKFGAFFDVIGNQFDKVATGHYAQVIEQDGIASLKISPDSIKDQTYFLACLDQAQVARALFPIGHLTKQEVRVYADRFNLANKNRKDSQGICFLGKISYPEFLEYHLGHKEGKLIEFETGQQVGTHRGFWFYTIGQRHSIGLSGGPWYVVAKNTQENIVYISKNYHTDDKQRDAFYIHNTHWIAEKRPHDGKYQVKMRHGALMYDCSLRWINDQKAHINLIGRDQGIAAGQFAVFYKDNVCLGSGVIC